MLCSFHVLQFLRLCAFLCWCSSPLSRSLSWAWGLVPAPGLKSPPNSLTGSRGVKYEHSASISQCRKVFDDDTRCAYVLLDTDFQYCSMCFEGKGCKSSTYGMTWNSVSPSYKSMISLPLSLALSLSQSRSLLPFGFTAVLAAAAETIARVVASVSIKSGDQK